jgi:hypothetical protein
MYGSNWEIPARVAMVYEHQLKGWSDYPIQSPQTKLNKVIADRVCFASEILDLPPSYKIRKVKIIATPPDDDETKGKEKIWTEDPDGTPKKRLIFSKSGRVLEGLEIGSIQEIPEPCSVPCPKLHIFQRPKTTYFSWGEQITYFSSAPKCIFFVGPKLHIFRRPQNHIFFVGPKSHIFRRTKTTFFSPDQNCIFFVGPKPHIFRRPKITYFSPAQNHIFFVGPKVHIFRQTKSTYFSPDQKYILFAGPKSHIFRRPTTT